MKHGQRDGRESPDDDLSPLAYARWAGIAIDPLTDRQPLDHIVSFAPSTPPDISDARIDADADVEEQPELNQGGAMLLGELSARHHQASSIFLERCLTRPCKQRLELPLLRGQHDTDLRKFTRRLDVHVRDVTLPAEPIDEKRGQGMAWPPSARDALRQTIRDVEGEKLVLTRDTLRHLAGMTKRVPPLHDDLGLTRKRRVLEPVTPPLLPISPPTTPYTASSPTCRLPTASDPILLLKDDLQATEDAIFRQKGETNVSTHSGAQQAPSSDEVGALLSLDEPPSPPAALVKTDDQKLEIPLLPASVVDFTKLPVVKTDLLKDVISQTTLPHRTPSPLSRCLNDDLEAFFNKASLEALTKANQHAEQEQLQVTNAVQKLPIPAMDFSKPSPPWRLSVSSFTTARTAARTRILANVRDELPLRCAGATSNERRLCWNPFVGKVSMTFLDEIIDAAEPLEQFLGVSTVITSSELTWKPVGLLILRQDADDALDTGVFTTEQPEDLSVLVRKRKSSHRDPFLVDVQQPRWPQSNGTEVGVLAASPPRESSILSNFFSPSAALDNFLRIRGKKTSTSVRSSYFEQNQAATPTHPPTATPIPLSIPFPVVTPTAQPTIIISSALFQRRQLFQTLQSSCPGVSLIERDFTAHDNITWARGSVDRSPLASPLSQEADVIPSPTTGILLTSIQKARQKPLPGTKSLPTLYGHIAGASLRYERLVVLVSEANADEVAAPLDSAGTEALSKLAAFAASLRRNSLVLVSFVAGGDAALGKYLGAVVARHAVTLPPNAVGGGNTQIGQQETRWEVFLRHAGLNPYAAQAVLLVLKPGEEKNGESGLMQLIRMPSSERWRRFKDIIGERSVGRMNKVLEQRWDGGDVLSC